MVQRLIKPLLLLFFMIFTLIGALFGAQPGVNYSHLKFAFFVLSIPVILIWATYFFRFKSEKMKASIYAVAALTVFYTSIVGGGYVSLINSIGDHERIIVSGPIVTKDQNVYRNRPSFHISFKDEASNDVLRIKLNSYEFNKLKVGDIYSETMYVGTFGLLYRAPQK